MQYSTFAGEKVSRLGFGTMRLPTLEDGSINEELVFEMVRYAADHGVNYFDTAYPYHGCRSEIVIGRALKQLPRESYNLATKYPGHQISESYDPAATFQEQLTKCQVDYFDFYLLHNVYENSYPVYIDPQWGIVDYFVKMHEEGKIRHLGFSTHALLPCLEEFLERYGDVLEFAQIQMNYLDWTMQDGPEKYALLEKYGLDVIVMEPVRGGLLADLGEAWNAQLKELEPDRSIASWALRWQLGTPAKVVLSGMSNMEQMVDNIATFTEAKPLSESENALLADIAESMKDNVPCTGCRYCCDSCPLGLDIPLFMKLTNDARIAPTNGIGMTIDSKPKGERPSDCLGCRSCEAMCPQSIPISEIMAELTERMSVIQHWEDACVQREADAAAVRAELA